MKLSGKFSAPGNTTNNIQQSIQMNANSMNSTSQKLQLIDICRLCIDYMTNDRYMLHEASYPNGCIQNVLKPTTNGNNGNNNNNNIVLDVRKIIERLQNTEVGKYFIFS